MDKYGMVIIGAGEAGTRAAVELRIQGWTGSITLIGEEKWEPYERPPLSKSLLLTDEEPSPVSIIDKSKLEEYHIEFISGVAVIKIDKESHFVKLADGRQIGYKRLLLATGARPRRLPTAPDVDTTNMLYLRTFSDALKLRHHLQPKKHIVVIGGGFIGLEVAASARERGCSVTLIEVGPRILMRGVPVELAKLVEERHRAAGVQFKLGSKIEKIDHTSNGYTIRLSDGTTIDSEVIIVGIGAIPETTLASDCGLEIENGIKTDECLKTSDPDIFAAGDCCSFIHGNYHNQRFRLEAWRNAQDQGLHVAGNMLGSNERFQIVPWFWSDQYDLTLQVVGFPDFGEVTVCRDLGNKGKLFFHLTKNNRLVAASGIGKPGIAKDIRISEMLIERQMKFDASILSDTDVKLKQLLTS